MFQILKGNSEDLTGLLDVGNFDVNVKSLNNLYETYVLSVGEFDERIFLGKFPTKEFSFASYIGSIVKLLAHKVTIFFFDI